LEEKAEENVVLAEQNKELHQRYQMYEKNLNQLEENMSSTEHLTKFGMNKEIEKKLESMSESLVILAQDNIELRAQLIAQRKKAKEAPQKDKKQIMTPNAIGDNINLLKAEVLRLSQIEESCDESQFLYDNFIDELNQKMTNSLKREQERRKKAEFDVQRLKQKIEELEFLLSEKEDTSSWSDDDESEKDKT